MDPMNRSNVLDMYFTINQQEKDDLALLFSELHVISSIANSNGKKIIMETFAPFVKNTYIHVANFCKFLPHLPNSLHWCLGHIIELLEMNDSYALGETSENGLEHMQQFARRMSLRLARKDTVHHQTQDAMKRLWIMSSHVIRNLRPKTSTSNANNNKASLMNGDNMLIKSFIQDISPQF